ncbi:hypothetical protein FACS1894145_1520 [Bacteroidia bacterium]|nr:hypothetical protein FACS1894145_1520 [Bacteroidia bacterium]
MIASFFGKKYRLQQIKTLFEFTRIGITIQDIVDNATQMGFNAKVLKLTTEELQTFPFPVILFWKQEHFLVYERATKRKNDSLFYLADPAYGRVKLHKDDFDTAWKGSNPKGIAVVLQPNENFEKTDLPDTTEKSWLSLPIYTQIKKFLQKNKLRYLLALFLIILGLAANWAIPFVFQRVIDDGISSKQINIVIYFLFAQFVLFVSYVISDFFSNLILTKFNFILSIDFDQLIHVCKLSNILDFIGNLPMKFNTKIGNAGIQLSGGETQRILIARALYKNPQFIFLDEATSALDAENEKIIHDNLQEFFKGKTVLIIAHRLSTVKNADQIIVLKNGQISEQGTHTQLVSNKGEYFYLVKNQLELGN